MNWLTAKRAHAGVLMDMKRGQVCWSDQPAVDRTRQRFTQRALRDHKAENIQLKICKRFNEGHCGKEDEHREGKIAYKHACL